MTTISPSSADFTRRLQQVKKDLVGKWLAISRDLHKTGRNGSKVSRNFAFIKKERARLEALGYQVWVPKSDRLTLHRRIEESDFYDCYTDEFEYWLKHLYLNSREKDIRQPLGTQKTAGFNPHKNYTKETTRGGEISHQKCQRMRAAYAKGKKIGELAKWYKCGWDTVSRHVHGRCDHD